MKSLRVLSSCAMSSRARKLVALLAGFLACGAMGDPAWAAPRVTSGPPKLVVLLAVDQMRADYVNLYGKTWKHGLRRLFDGGAVFRNARYPYLATVTCPGHFTLGTGAYPNKHGMVLNGWWDRGTKKLIECTADSTSPIVSYGRSHSEGGDSANNLLIPTLADEMKTQLSPSPRAVSFSFKARSAIGLAGHKPDLVTWYEGGGWVTAKAFSSEPSPVIAKLLDDNPIDGALDTPWEKVLPAAAYKYRDDAPEERAPSSQWSRTFPKPLTYVEPAAARSPAGSQKYSLWERSPLPDDLLGRLAQGTLLELGLGKGPGVDFLAVGFSALDTVGHAYGPFSHEVQDVLARLDRVLGDFLTTLDKQVGRGNYVLALSSDHGVAAYPERLRAEGQDAGRVSTRDVSAKLSALLKREIGPGTHVENVSYTDIYLAPGVLDKLKAKPELLKQAMDAVRSVDGVAAVYSTDELRDPTKTTDPVQRAVALSHYPGRSGDLVLVTRKNWIVTSTGTTHGTHHDYDQHVPVLFYGSGIRPGKYDRPASPADVVPTLARRLGVTMSHAEGTALDEALTGQSTRPTRAPDKVQGRRPVRGPEDPK